MASHNKTSSTKMTPEACWQWLEEKTFRLQPKAYKSSYPDWPGAVGLEIEMLPLLPPVEGSEKPRSVRLQGAEDCLASWLRNLAQDRHWDLKESDDHEQRLLMNVLLDEDDNLSFEPGGQLEFSSKPYCCLSQATTRTTNIQGILDEFLGRHGVTLTQVGLNPWHSVDEIGLQMQKSRYRAMNDFFSKISEYGPRMMRQTCTVQVNLDFGPDEATMAKRYLASILMAPFSGAVFNYSAFSEQKPVGMTGLRSKVWRHLDPSRTGVPPLAGLSRRLTKEACVQTYFDFLMAARVVFVTDLDYKVMHEPLTWADWMKNGVDGVYPNLEDFDTHLSLLFPEVRARGFLELRSVDCQSRVWQFAPAAWWTGLLYDATACDQVIEMLLPLAGRMTELLDAAPLGLQHPVLKEGAHKLMTTAEEGLSRLAECYCGEGVQRILHIFAERFTWRGRVPADDVLDAYRQRGVLTQDCFRRTEDQWRQLIEGS